MRQRDIHQAALLARIGAGELAHDVLGDRTVGAKEAMAAPLADGTTDDEDEVDDDERMRRFARAWAEVADELAEIEREKEEAEEDKKRRQRKSFIHGPVGKAPIFTPEPKPDTWLRWQIEHDRKHT